MEYWTQQSNDGNKHPIEWWTLNSDSRIYAYIQPGGCLEIGEYIEEDGKQDFAHFCVEDHAAVKEMMEYWENKVEEIRKSL